MLSLSAESGRHTDLLRVLSSSSGFIVGISVTHDITIAACMSRDVWTAGRQYAACQELCQQVEAKHADFWSITLPYCSNESIISSSAAKAKVDSLKSYQVSHA
jgi:hypothetical protein